MKNVICKEFGYAEFRKYQIELLSRKGSSLFLPMSFQVLGDGEDKRILACYDISDTNPLGIIYDGAEAPYIASELMDGMMDSLDSYFVPHDYLMEGEFIYKDRRGMLKSAFVPSGETIGFSGNSSVGLGKLYSEMGKEIKNKLLVLLGEIYPREGVAYPDILEKTLKILGEEEIGFDTCRRRIELLKEESVRRRVERAIDSLDLSGSFV